MSDRGPSSEPRSPAAAGMWPKRVARVSILAALACFILQCTVFQLTAPRESSAGGTAPPHAPQRERPALRRLVDSAGFALVLGGFTLGLAALVGGVRAKASEAIAMAVIGLLLNGGVLAIIGWYFLVLRPQLAPGGG